MGALPAQELSEWLEKISGDTMNERATILSAVERFTADKLPRSRGRI